MCIGHLKGKETTTIDTAVHKKPGEGSNLPRGRVGGIVKKGSKSGEVCERCARLNGRSSWWKKCFC